ncbi:hypothetical protein ACJ72_01740 [Emergomyces africanus]|uniref:Uncharacterized protein n=1 Tax=Emergomyces africanus TaxID=1955775 RepID=A0A1B7P4D6_9EURO|nr:hypothetical protein ACJ72_01740 [Emergomyces africanus]
MLQTMDIIDDFILWTSERPVWAVVFAIYALASLFFVSVVIVEVTDFIWTLLRKRLLLWMPNCSWTSERRRAIHLSGPERRLIGVPAGDGDERWTEIKKETHDERGEY